MLARDSEPGGFYRPTRLQGWSPGTFFARPKVTTADTFVGRLRKRGHGRTVRECYLCQIYKANPQVILFIRRTRGIDGLTGQRFESREPVLLPPDYRLRQIQKPPGYTHKS